MFQEIRSQCGSEGEITDSCSHQDLLAQALPTKEYPGRVRGVGFGVSQKSILGSRKCTNHEKTEELQQKVEFLLKELQELKSTKVHQPELPIPTPDIVRPIPISVTDSCNFTVPGVIEFFTVPTLLLRMNRILIVYNRKEKIENKVGMNLWHAVVFYVKKNLALLVE